MENNLLIPNVTPPPNDIDDQRWESICRNHASADGQFYYAVATTGIYCRPSCPSRLPKRKNVRFFDTIAEAEANGFRPCKRCQPNGKSLEELHAQSVAKACRLIQRSEKAPTLDELATHVAMSPFHFQRVFKQIAGMSPSAYHRSLQGKQVRSELQHSNSVTEAIHEANYSSTSRFYETSDQTLGMKPQTYLKGGAGERIQFAVGECSLGSVLVASSAIGICALALGDAPEPLLTDLQNQFSKAELVAGDEAYQQLISQVIALLEDSTLEWNLPLDIRGTMFQLRVWKALQKIPAGQTYSYSELAEKLGSPTSARAIARACASNRIAVAIPCHRIIRTDGSLSGYRWGIDRKQTLIQRERDAQK